MSKPSKKHQTEIDRLKQAVKNLEAEVTRERALRLQAQRGLVRYLKEAGLWKDTYYDPDHDPQIVEGIKAGIYPPSLGEWNFQEVIKEMTKAVA